MTTLLVVLLLLVAGHGLAGDPESRTIHLHYQFGAFSRIHEEDVRPDKLGFLLTGDLTIFAGTPAERRWGLGARLALDDDGHRWGPRVARRFHLSRDGRLYVQPAGILYLSGEDNAMDLELPAYGVEIEVGYTDLLALAIGVEAIPFRNLDDWSTETDTGDRVLRVDAAGTSLSGYAGIKAGQLPGVAAALAFVIVTAATYD